MIQDIVRAIIQRIFRDKILMGLLLIGFLAVFMTGAHPGQNRGTAEKPVNNNKRAPGGENQNQQLTLRPIDKKAMSQKVSQNHPDQQQQAAQAQTQIPANHLKPDEAEEFITWWVTGAMDFNPNTAIKNRKKAMAWMTEGAAQTFEQSFWTDELKNGVTQGTIIASFQPVSVHATAVNPDGSVVVHVKGSVAMQVAGQQPSTEHLLTDYLVVKKKKGYRIAAVDSKTYIQANNTHYYY